MKTNLPKIEASNCPSEEDSGAQVVVGTLLRVRLLAILQVDLVSVGPLEGNGAAPVAVVVNQPLGFGQSLLERSLHYFRAEVPAIHVEPSHQVIVELSE
jgi:hypothetical protein